MSTNLLTKHRHWRYASRLLAILMAMFSSTLPQAALADENENTALYLVTPAGVDKLNIEMPVYDDAGYDGWIDDGNIYVTPQGGNKQMLLHYYSQNMSGDYPQVWLYKGVDGEMVLKRDRGYSNVTITTSEQKVEVPFQTGSTSNVAKLYLTWTVPASMRGMPLTITWKVHKTGNGPAGPAGESSTDVNVNSSSVTFTAVPAPTKPTLMSPILGYDTSHAGELMIIYTMATSDILSLRAFYTEVNGGAEIRKSKFLTPEMSGFLTLDADKCYKDVYIRAKYIDSEKKERFSESDHITVPTLHQAHDLTAAMQTDGSVRLSWRCRDNHWTDINTSDSWEIQRNTTGGLNAEAQWTQLNPVTFTNSDTLYTVVDNTLVDAYQGETVYYRVRRASTNAWNWQEGSYALTQLPYPLWLPAVGEATVTRGTWNETSHPVDFTFGFGGQQYKGDTFIMRTAEDWETLARMVKENNRKYDVVMAADIDLPKGHSMIGSSGSPYRGTFDGNGHTLTVNLVDTQHQYVAPFSYVGDATFKNLHVAGKVLAREKFTGGLIGKAESIVHLNNCRSSVYLTTQITGDATSGGFTAHQIQWGEYENCLFDGALIGSNAHSFGGFVGWSATTSSIKNCLFAPIRVDIDTTLVSCRNFVRSFPAYEADIKNSYYLTSIEGLETVKIDGVEYNVLRTADDWDKFRQKVIDANGNRDVNAIMASDFTAIYSIGFLNNIPYRGIFDGNGHTLTVNINGTANAFIAPFYQISGATIKNLNVQGTVRGGIHSAGLVGIANNGYTNYIENCHVSVDILTTDHYAGGIMGHGHSAKNYIRNCFFDGSITADSYTTDSYAGAIMGWEDGGTSNVIQNNLEDGAYNNFNHVGMNYARGSAYGATNSWTTKKWGEANKAEGLSSAELVEKLGAANWQSWGSLAEPKMKTAEFFQGKNGWDMSVSQLTTTMGAQWEHGGLYPTPKYNISTDSEYAATIWDDHAVLALIVEKSVGGEVKYTERRELSSDERKSGKLHYELATSCVEHDFRFVVEKGSSRLEPLDNLGTKVRKTEEGELARYEFNDNVKVDSLKCTTQQSAVVLTWNVTGTGDFFRILRRDKATGEEVELESAYTINTYIDKTPKAQHVYTYTVEGVTNCEGQQVSATSADGWCSPTGMVRGYVRLTDGTGLANIKVTAEPDDATREDGGVERYAVTDETGFFEIDSLIYQGQGTYFITATGTGEESSFTSFTANFSEDCNLVTNARVVMSTYYLLSGYVMYEGTSVPVVGAQFERDGEPVHNGSGSPVVSDSQGKFTVSLPAGEHSIRVVKDGHVFADDGFYVDPDAAKPTKPSWQKSKDGYVFWDQTRIMLQGRVVGGNLQGDKPLGKLLSVNNLGDSLTIVMQLEGDNASWLVRDQQNPSVKERHTDYWFGTDQQDSCHMDVYRQRLVIKPSPVTGEYLVPMLPVKYKVTEIYAEGYATLFQAGEVGQTLDLSRYVQGDTATYNRVYHTAPSLAVSQFNLTGQTYMGIPSYTDMDNTGKVVSIELWNDSTGYAFGHPVFMAGSPVIMTLSAVEKYFKNNNMQYEPDVVHLSGGEVRISNALTGSNEKEVVRLDSLGEAIYRFVPQNLTFTEEDDMALKTLTMTLLYDSTFYDVLPLNGEPVRGYVMASKAKSQGRRVVNDGGTYLIDILRDPPGAGSSAYIETGTKLNYTFTENVKAQVGAKFTFGKTGGAANIWHGIWAGTTMGDIYGGTEVSVKDKDMFTLSLVSTYYNSWQYGYSFETTERISTSSSNMSVGRDADVFIGMTRSSILEDGIAVRVINEDTYNLLTTHAGGTYSIDGVDFSVKQGTMKVLAQGKDSSGKKVYLVRDEVLRFYTDLTSTFAHSQTYIEKELIPELFNLRNSLILPKGTSEATAREVAKTKGCAVYISKVAIDDDNFAISKDFYTQVNPDPNVAMNDSVLALNNKIRTWLGFLATNEKEKLTANDLVKRYEVDGRSSVTYSESFGTSLSESRYWQIPLIGTGFGNVSFGNGMTFKNINGGGTPTGSQTGKQLSDDEGNSMTIEFDAFHTGLYVKIVPVLSFDYNYNYGKSENHTKKVGFTLAPSRNSNLIVDVYRATMDKNELNNRVDSMAAHGYTDPKDYFFQYLTDEYVQFVQHGGESGKDYGPAGSLYGVCSYLKDMPTQYRSIVYRTRGGATCQPYEDERKTKYFSQGQVLDSKTVPIDNLRIWVDQASVSNVPFDEPARFTIHMANESEMPALMTEAFVYFLDDSSNPKGAKVQVEGNPLSGTGYSVFLPAGQVVTKEVELYPSSEFDYDNIVISIFDPSDKKRIQSVNLSAHFVPTAGKVNISLPGDKWVVNTESQYDAGRQQYYMPVRIDGFDVNYRNFDHIELQYKLSTKGDKEWVNVCSFYKDSTLMAKATGECKYIEDDGHIIASFYGETDPVEQQYDLRAVNYCRYGGGYLTRSSNILTGIKDTRRPQLFGNPRPEDGILDIGDDIMLRFSEPIAGNYLRDLNNFQVLGQTNTSNIALSTCLRFNGNETATSESTRNLSAKSFTVDLMVKPDRTGKNMTFFSHGDTDNILELGISADRHLMAAVGDKVYYSTDTVSFGALHQVEYVFEADVENTKTKVSFYDGSKQIGSFEHPVLYTGTGHIHLGSPNPNVTHDINHYEGEMLEFRLWNRALSENEMNEYRQKRLTGFELGLLDNWPLNEGHGSYSYNTVGSGGDLNVQNTEWSVPDGISMKLDGKEGFRIDPQLFSRKDYHDYTMTFWFCTSDTAGTILSNGQAQTEDAYRDHFNFGVDKGLFSLWLGGHEYITNSSVNDGAWHHVALTVSRSRNVGKLYLDKELKKTFPVDTLGGINGRYLAAGATYLSDDKVERPLNGYIDEIAMYEMALPENMIKAASNISLSGQELGLLAYLGFGQNETTNNNMQRLMPTGVSMKRYRDDTTGEWTNDRDTLVAQDVVDRLASREHYAPMSGSVALENIKYSFVADGKDLLINLDVPEYSVEKTNLIVTVKDVADLNGNLLASPVTMDLYVYRNPLRWNVKQVTTEAYYGYETMFTACVENLSGRNCRYTLEGLPVWVTASQTSGIIGPLGEQEITFTVSPYINIGNYDEMIYLVGEDGMTEPLPLNIKVRGDIPQWKVDQNLLHANISMSIIGQVEVNGSIAHSSEDMLAAFDEDHRLMGVTHLSGEGNGLVNDGLAYLTVYNNDYTEKQLYFEFFDASTGIIHQMMPSVETKFKSDTVLGTTEEPVIFSHNNGVVQAVPLKEGWNWVSFNLEPAEETVSKLLNNATQWQVGDALEIEQPDGTYSVLSYKVTPNPYDPSAPFYSWDCADSIVDINPAKMYRFFSTNEKVGYFRGFTSDNSIKVAKGWNRIGYISRINLPLGTAMAQYADKGQVGDIIKSQSQFAVLAEDGAGNRIWKGTLNFLRVGEGYMIKSASQNTITFNYPNYLAASRYGGEALAPEHENVSGTNMTVVAVAVGTEVVPGDRLVAYRGAEVCGVAQADEEGKFYLVVGGSNAAPGQQEQTPLTFTLERDDEVQAVTTSRQMTYRADDALGTPDEPTVINFLSVDEMDSEGWYSLSGVKLNNRPSQRGVYIHNHEKVTIK